MLLGMNGPQKPGAAPRDPLSERVIGCGIEVHRQLGPGLLESVYERVSSVGVEERRDARSPTGAIAYSIQERPTRRELPLDLIVENKLVLEIKTVERLAPIQARCFDLASSGWSSSQNVPLRSSKNSVPQCLCVVSTTLDRHQTEGYLVRIFLSGHRRTLCLSASVLNHAGPPRAAVSDLSAPVQN
jgi:GxxExxY protein